MTRRRGRVEAGVLSMLLPGAGHLYAGARTRGLALLGITGVLLLALVVVAVARPAGLAAALVDLRAAAVLLALNVALFAFRLFAVIDSWRLRSVASSRVAVGALAAFAMLTAVPHVAAGYVTVRGYGVLQAVFAEQEPGDAPGRDAPLLAPSPVPGQGTGPAEVAGGEPLADSSQVLVGSDVATQDPWVTVLLLGSDAGPEQWGERTDTIIAVALQRDTGRAVAFGIPRNFVEVPLVGEATRELPTFEEPLNGLYAHAQERPDLFPGGEDPGATALKQTVSALVGMRLDYYALVDLAGFADLVDALGGVEIHVKERLVDEVTRPRWGVPKPRIDVYQGQTYRFDGMQALAYVRSRKASSDYGRMQRQRCFLSALTRQLDVLTVLRNFGTLASTVERGVRTDIPLARLPDLIRLAAATDPGLTLMETFGVPYIDRRREADGYPVPDVAEIHATVRETILFPRDAVETGLATSVQRAC